MDDLVTWLRAQLDEDERVARAAAEDGPEWHFQPALGEPDGSLDLEASFTMSGGYKPDATDFDHDWLVHIARHDPARVLREVEAKRRLIEQIGFYASTIDGEWGCCHDAAAILAGRCPDIAVGEIAALRVLALPYAAREGFREEWRP